MPSPKEILRFRIDVAGHPQWPRAMFLGDSWFQYPPNPIDIHKKLRSTFKKTHFWNDSKAGRESGDIKQIIRRAARALGEFQFNALVLSMGGNDVVGTELVEFVKRADEPQSYGQTRWGVIPPPVRDHIRLSTFEAALAYVVEDYKQVIGIRNREAPHCEIVAHTYDYPWPDGTPFKLLGIKAGPWLKPYLDDVGMTKPADQRETAIWLIDQFARVLNELTSQTSRMRLVDARGTLKTRAHWQNEIHPNKAGFTKLVNEVWKPALASGGLFK